MFGVLVLVQNSLMFYRQGSNPVAALEQDISNVPIILGLNETLELEIPTMQVGINIYFIQRQ